jgi:prepilin-type N-terminal cleavage/methylation domain-containing protein
VKLHHRGFTLVEVLISLVLTGLVLGLLYDLLTTQHSPCIDKAPRVRIERGLSGCRP